MHYNLFRTWYIPYCGVAVITLLILVDCKNNSISIKDSAHKKSAFMCTGIRLKAQNGAVVYGRTMEFGKKIESSILVVPRNYSFTATTPFDGVDGLQWKSKYAVVGPNVSDVVHFVDGVNEVGLAGGLFYFSEYAEFQNIDRADCPKSLAPSELMTFLLTTCASVQEVKKVLPTIKVSKTMFKPWGFIPPVHAIVHDIDGNSLVIEYIKGALHLYDNPLGVITNSPTFDWHLTNLKNYHSLFARAQRMVSKCGDVKQKQGSAMLGLPGDFSSTSRFVRAALFSQIIVPPDNEDETRDVLFHLLNLFDIPIGIERMVENCQEMYDYTQWTSVADLRNKKYYFHTYENRQIHCVDLLKCNGSEVKTISMKHPQEIVDCTLSN